MLDVLIIGGGSAGLSAAIYACRAKLKSLVLEKEYMGLGQIADSERVENYPALYGISGYDLAFKFHEHAEKVGACFKENEAVKIEKNKDKITWKVTLDSGETIDTKTIVYCAGTYRRRLNIKGEKEFSARGISYCAICDGAFYKDKNVAVIGGGDTALTDAIYLSKIAKLIFIIHRRGELRANKTLQKKVEETENIKLILNSTPIEFFGDKMLSGIKYIQNSEEKSIDISGSFTAIGSIPNIDILKGIAELDEKGYVIADETGVTSAKGIFVAGDVRTKALRQVITATADGANCIESVINFLKYN